MQNYNKFAVYEPRCEINNERSWVIVKGGQTVTYTQYPATSFSNSNFIFIADPPGKTNILDRVCIIEVPVSLDFSTAAPIAGQLLVQEGKDSFRAYPISSVTSTLTAKINGFPVSIELNEVVHLLSRFHTSMQDKRDHLSLTLPMDDNYQSYLDGIGANNNPLGTYQDNPAEIPRGAYYADINVATYVNTEESAHIDAVLREYIILPPFIWDGCQAGGLTNLDTFQMDWILTPQLQRIWSRAPASLVHTGLSSLLVNFQKPSLWLGWITPRLTQPIPRVMSYPYFQISKYITNQPVGALAPNTSAELPSQLIQFNSIPRKLYVFAKQSNTIINQSLANTLNFPDVFLRIDKINISWDNIDGVLSGASPHNLWELSVENGLKMPWTEWRGYTPNFGTTSPAPAVRVGLSGGPLCIELGKDLGLRDNQCEGVLDKINFQVRLTVTNTNQFVSLTPDLYVIAVYDGVLEIFDNSARAYIGVINSSDILNAPINHDVTYKMLQKIYGGDFFSKFKDIASKVVKGLKDSKAISSALGAIPNPYAQIGSQVAKSLGFGARAGVKAGCMYCPPGQCVCLAERQGEGGVLMGGKDVDYREMKKRLKQIRKR